MDHDTTGDGVGPPVPPVKVQNQATTTNTPTGRPRRSADGSGLFDLLAATSGSGASAAATRVTATARAPTISAWARGPPRRPRLGLNLPTVKFKMPASAQSTRLFEQTVTVTLVGKGWSQVRNDQVLKGLADHDVDISTIEGVWNELKTQTSTHHVCQP